MVCSIFRMIGGKWMDGVLGIFFLLVVLFLWSINYRLYGIQHEIRRLNDNLERWGAGLSSFGGVQTTEPN